MTEQGDKREKNSPPRIRERGLFSHGSALVILFAMVAVIFLVLQKAPARKAANDEGFFKARLSFARFYLCAFIVLQRDVTGVFH